MRTALSLLSGAILSRGRVEMCKIGPFSEQWQQVLLRMALAYPFGLNVNRGISIPHRGSISSCPHGGCPLDCFAPACFSKLCRLTITISGFCASKRKNQDLVEDITLYKFRRCQAPRSPGGWRNSFWNSSRRFKPNTDRFLFCIILVSYSRGLVGAHIFSFFYRAPSSPGGLDLSSNW